MSNSYLNVILFLLTTLLYYYSLKPILNIDILLDPVKYKNYTTNNYVYLAIYLLAVIIVQFLVNISIISSICGGKLSLNIGTAFGYTFIPWVLLFGVIVLVLSIYPSFKSVFSDVIGYYYISSSANKLLTELLINKEINNKIKTDPNLINEESQKNMQSTADAIIKIFGDNSILINQILPTNFTDYWSILTPLMKPKYKNPTDPETIKLKNNLLELVVTKDNIGESMWYIYTGVLLCMYVQLKITTNGCLNNTQTMQQNYEDYITKEKQANEEKEKTQTTYTISS